MESLWVILAGMPVQVLLILQAGAGNGIAELQQAESFLHGSFFSFRDLSFVLAGLIAIAGAVSVYHKWQMGKDVSMDVPAWFFSSLFVLVLGLMVAGFFGL
ncbi:DUF4134 family protein [Pedobacter agri]|uniref:DUF4134 family protein n=1 Tax=Pedobacter agri TaxID=454586 RepID=A0A9X3DCN1_9SPHI|nr:DUF4134 family protein [Pedobacter agri]MCX3264984.1 DUF4134 family protein [Pedobacter agri]